MCTGLPFDEGLRAQDYESLLMSRASAPVPEGVDAETGLPRRTVSQSVTCGSAAPVAL